MKIRIAYLDEEELKAVLDKLEPFLKDAKVKKDTKTKPYKHLYISFGKVYKEGEQN